MACMAAMRSAMISSSSSRFSGFSGKKSPKRSMNCSKSGSSPRWRCSSISLSADEHVLHAGHVLGRDVAHGPGHLVEVALRELLAQLVEQLLEALPGLARGELVVLEVLDLAGQVGRQHVELHAGARPPPAR